MTFFLTKQPKSVTGTCFNISIYRTANDCELLSIMVRDKDMQCWKCNLGEWYKCMDNYQEITDLMSKEVSVEIDFNAQPGTGYHTARFVPQKSNQNVHN